MTDIILQELQQLELGYHIGGAFAAAIAHANDLVLLSPSLVDMHHMFDPFVNLLASTGLQFNIDKCIAAVSGKPASPQKCLEVYGVKLTRSEKLCDIGIIFIINSDLKDVSLLIQKFTAAVCALLRGAYYWL